MHGATIFIDFEFQVERGMPLKLIEIGAIRIHNGEVATFSSLVRQKGIQAEVLTLTGIEREQLQQAPLYKDVSEQFLQFVGEQPTFVFFSSQDREIFYANRFWQPLLVTSKFIDYQEKLMVHFNELRKPSLSALLERFQLPSNVQHRALSDAQALMELYEASNGDELLRTQQTTTIFAPFVRRSMKQREEHVTITIYEYNIATKQRHTHEWQFTVPQQEIEVLVNAAHSGLLSTMQTTTVEKQLIYGRNEQSDATLSQINELIVGALLFAPTERCGLVNVFLDYGMTMNKCLIVPYFIVEGSIYNKEQTDRLLKVFKAVRQGGSPTYATMFDVFTMHDREITSYLRQTAVLE